MDKHKINNIGQVDALVDIITHIVADGVTFTKIREIGTIWKNESTGVKMKSKELSKYLFKKYNKWYTQNSPDTIYLEK